jgi:hypothetical protein
MIFLLSFHHVSAGSGRSAGVGKELGWRRKEKLTHSPEKSQ